MDIKISIIIPVYNAEKYLPACLDSVCRQSVQGIEIICVNDGSTDGSLQILKSYAEKDSRIQVISQKNQGVSVARNESIGAATGKYIQFLDSDDMLEPKTLEYAVQQMEEKNLDVFYFDARAIFESAQLEKEKSSYKTYYHRENHYQDVRTGSQLFTEWIKDGGFRPNGNLQMIRRDFLLQSGVKFIPGIVQEDNAFTAEVMLQARRVCHENKTLYIRRVRSDSIMTKPQAFINAYGYFRCAMALEKYFFKTVISEETRSALQIFCQSLLRNMEGIYSNISEAEKEKIQTLPEEERAAMLYLCWYNEQAVKNRAEMIKKASELRALNEKKGILVKQYHKVSEDKKRLQKKVDSLEKRQEILKADFTAMQQSLSFRLGRKLTWLPRKLRDAFIR